MIIAIESASSDPSLALASSDGVAFAADGWAGEGRQASELLPRLLVLLARAGRDLREATALAIGVGALRLPLVGVPSLQAWLEAEHRAAAAVARAGAQDAYLLLRGDPEPRIVAAAELSGLLKGSMLAAPSELAASFTLAGALPPHEAAAAVARLGAARLLADPRGDDLATIEPWYHRAPRGAPSSATVSRWP
jgi:tRNA A37 threonylcarbamoyladenosine modification protein TsaB